MNKVREVEVNSGTSANLVTRNAAVTIKRTVRGKRRRNANGRIVTANRATSDAGTSSANSGRADRVPVSAVHPHARREGGGRGSEKGSGCRSALPTDRL